MSDRLSSGLTFSLPSRRIQVLVIGAASQARNDRLIDSSKGFQEIGLRVDHDGPYPATLSSRRWAGSSKEDSIIICVSRWPLDGRSYHRHTVAASKEIFHEAAIGRRMHHFFTGGWTRMHSSSCLGLTDDAFMDIELYW